MSRGSRISEDPGKYFSASASSRKLEIWILFSDRDPNPGPNDDNCFGVELYNKTSSAIKFGTSRTGRMSRVWFYLLWIGNPYKNGGKWWFSDPGDLHFAVRQIRHLWMGKGKTREMEIPGKSKMADNYRRLLENPIFTGNSPNWNPTTEKIVLTLATVG